jgi:ribonucleoside-diphosphate reductase alpha chain
MTGPKIPIAIWADETKHRQEGETHSQKCGRVAGALTDNQEHYEAFYDILSDQRFLPGGRVAAGAGSYRRVTAFNCYVMKQVPDDFLGIMEVFTEAGQTMRMGGGVGYDFSAIRPRGSRIKTLGTQASGPVTFMQIADAMCKTIASAGHRRGAQMATLRVDHPDIMEFVTAKSNEHNLTQFNMSVLVTDKFMWAVEDDADFDLVFGGRVYETISARHLWDTILRNTWDWAEPGVIFIDQVNRMNNLWYVENISATNPCGEQPLPEYGACLLGSFNLTRYLKDDVNWGFFFEFDRLVADIPHVVRAMDNVIDETTYPLYQQQIEAKNKRRMGLGITGLANVLGVLGIEYGSKDSQLFLHQIMETITTDCYKASVDLAKEKGAFPLFDADKYTRSNFIKKLPDWLQEDIYYYGIRNSHLTSIAPTGTISLVANNVSSGIEPVFSHQYERTVKTVDGSFVETVEDYALREWGMECKTADQVTVDEHVDMLLAAQEWVDSAVSKTCNVGNDVTWEEFKGIYNKAFYGGAKGCTTFRPAGKRFGILNASASEDIIEEENKEDETVIKGGACYIDQETGIRSCE